MTAGSYENIRSKKIAAELKEKILNGEFTRGARFHTREELAERYGISPVTAFRVLKQLEGENLIVCGRGRRAVLLTGREASPSFRPAQKLKIVLAADRTGPGIPDAGLEWLLRCLPNRLKNDGQQVLLRDGAEALPDADGSLVLQTREQAPGRYRELRAGRKPFCMLSGVPSENTVFLLPQASLMRMILFFSERHVRSIRILRGSDSPFERMMTPDPDMLSADYGMRFQGEETVSPEEAQDPERLRAILRGQRETKDSAIFCTNQILSERIWEAAAALRFRDVVMTGVSGIRQKRPYPVLHLDAAGFLSSFLGMLYRQFRTGRVRDPGILFQPEFLLPES